ncbi:hypothetical protein [Azospirillum sp.]|uniref:hypothetical protein n=1 Tax=Azospirillum sp. TaxID=34012 RepID=UPI002D276401|nr:hypothetical protein [Azospirillum sp.]HYD64107.1 hypothetical protein [Azospirillum sp.]
MDARPSPAARGPRNTPRIAPRTGTEIQRALSAAAELDRFAIAGTSPHQRPPLSLPVVRALAARVLAERIAAAAVNAANAVDAEALAAQIMLVTRHRRDGAAIAAELARRFGQPDFGRPDESAVAAVLDDYTYELLLAHDRLVAAWAAAHGIEPVLSIGDPIRVVTNDHDWRPVEVTGEIVGIDRAHAKYHVFSAALGHSPDGPGPAFRAIPFEDVRAIGEEPTRDAA